MRRSRYTVFLKGIKEPKVILAYEHGSVVAYYERRGYTVEHVQMGDYRKQERQRKAQQHGQRFVVDQRALAAACKQFPALTPGAAVGIRLPVKTRLHGRVGNTHGNHRFEGLYHNVMLKSYRSVEEANETLWHELTHCKQAEECIDRGGDPHHYFRKQHEDYAYKRRPIEVEASRVARAHRHIMLLRAI